MYRFIKIEDPLIFDIIKKKKAGKKNQINTNKNLFEHILSIFILPFLRIVKETIKEIQIPTINRRKSVIGNQAVMRSIIPGFSPKEYNFRFPKRSIN
jgi:aspartate/glutamate racemase